MEKLKMHTMDLINDNVKRIGSLFPECITEIISDDGKLSKVVDFSILNKLLGYNAISNDLKMGGGYKERYQFSWPDKSKAIAIVNQPINATLRPVREESVNFDSTENLYIEGDNLDVLKLLRETYYGKIKMIYIDPPYNTGNDFVYKDKFQMPDGSYKIIGGDFDSEGNQLVNNPKSEGKYHTNWLNMMYPRLKIAKDLLSEDGILFISIDDNEIVNLLRICDEIFGEQNREGIIHWRRRHNQPNDKTKLLGIVAEFIVCYSKNDKFLKQSGVGKLPVTVSFSNPDNDPKGAWASKPWKAGSDQGGCKYRIISPTGKVFEETWLGTEATYNELKKDGRIYFPNNGHGVPRKKYYQSERVLEGMCASNWWTHEEFGHNQGGNEEMANIFDGCKNIFSNPKPTKLLEGLVRLGNLKTNEIVLDFFSGSSTTAHAVMKLNSEDGGHRKFIMVQLPEKCDEKSEAYKAGYKNICEIGKERIRRAGKKILEEKNTNSDDLFADNSNTLDVGFRVLKLDSSNMKDVYYRPDELDQDELTNLISNIKEGRSSEDLLFQVMLDLGVLLSSKIETIEINGKNVFNVNNGYLMACFDEDVDEKTVIEVAKKNPQFFVMRDSSMNADSMMVNFDQIFDRFSPETIRKVI